MFGRTVKRISHIVMVRVFTLLEVLGLPSRNRSRRNHGEAS